MSWWPTRGRVFEPRPAYHACAMLGFDKLPLSIQRLTCSGRYGISIWGTGDERFTLYIETKYEFRPVRNRACRIWHKMYGLLRSEDIHAQLC